MTTETDNKSPPRKNIYQRIHAVMQRVDYVQKEAKKQGMQYSFVSHDSVTAAIRPHLVDEGVIYFPQNLEYTQDGNRTAVTMDLHFVSIDDEKDRLIVPSFGFGIDSQDKGPGKAVSYAIKYALLKTFGLETGDDPEKDSIDHKPTEPKQTQPVRKPATAAAPAAAVAKPTVEEDPNRAWIKTQQGLIAGFKTIDQVNQWQSANVEHLQALSDPQYDYISNVANKRINVLSQAPLPVRETPRAGSAA